MRRVVITGLGIISPIGNNKEEFLSALQNGKNGIDFIKSFDTTNYLARLAAEVKGFEPLKVMPKPEARRTDRYAQLALAAANQAVLDAGGLPCQPERAGVYVGAGIGGISTFETEAKKCHSYGPSCVSPYFISMMIPNIAAGLISIKFDILGPTLPAVTACATSSHAIGEAFRAIKHGYADVILAGGSEASITPLSVAGFTNCMALSQSQDIDAASTPFDKRRSGFVMGEGAAVLVLEEYENAKKRNAKIYAEICGYGNTSDAFHVTAPRADGERAAAAITSAIKEADKNAQPNQIYINAHGTSTPLNDKIETLAIKKVFGTDAYKVAISSTKSMTGHCLGAAGAIESAACILSLKHSFIPPTINYKEKDPECDLDYTPNQARQKDISLAISNSFGFGGHNASLAFCKI